MCGIAGIISFYSSVDPKMLMKMTDIVKYRGPDDYGYLGVDLNNGFYFPFKKIEEFSGSSINGNFQLILGHRRLSIIDLTEKGHQPMMYGNGSLWITYNGEIYNYVEIREEFKKKGYLFKSQSDTEVILASYLEWGKGCIEKFNGMWAFAILDVSNRELFCARDRLGVKPFYYHFNGEKFSFGSEIKQLLSLPWVKSDIHPGVLFDYISLNAYGSNSEQT